MIVQPTSTSFYTLFYFIFTLGFVLQSREFIGAGLTPENILSRWLQIKLEGNSRNVKRVISQFR